MKVKELIKQLEQLNPNAECVFAEYTEESKTRLWYLGFCCNHEHQEEKKSSLVQQKYVSTRLAKLAASQVRGLALALTF